jgi:hypothetical protein
MVVVAIPWIFSNFLENFYNAVALTTKPLDFFFCPY